MNLRIASRQPLFVLLLISCLAAALSATSETARADGLVFQLPRDGTSVKYKMAFESARRNSTGSLTVSSVGQTDTDDGKGRWIEFQMIMDDGGRTRTIIAKLHIPEKNLGRGQHAFAHATKVYQRMGDQETKELDAKNPRNAGPLPAFLTGKLNEQKDLDAVEVESGLGKLKCKGVKGNLAFKDGGSDIEVEMENRLHEQAPFGVVSCTMAFDVSRNGEKKEGGKITLTVDKVGMGAKSELPDSN